MNISIVIPAYNEGERISNTLTKIIDFLSEKNYEFEIIVIDDGSDDTTSQDAENIFKKYNLKNSKVIKTKHHGKGHAVKIGVMNSKGDLIYFTDADLSTPINELEKFITEIKNCDVVIGSRAINGAKIIIHQPFYRELLGRMFNKFVRLFLKLPFYDTQCGAKLFKRDVAKRIFEILKTNKFAFDVEALFLAHKFGYRIKEVPVIWSNSKNTKVKAFKDGLRMLFDVIKIPFSYRKIK